MNESAGIQLLLDMLSLGGICGLAAAAALIVAEHADHIMAWVNSGHW